MLVLHRSVSLKVLVFVTILTLVLVSIVHPVKTKTNAQPVSFASYTYAKGTFPYSSVNTTEPWGMNWCTLTHPDVFELAGITPGEIKKVVSAYNIGESLLLKTDGTVWGWGRNQYNLYGGRIGPTEQPGQIAGLTNIVDIVISRDPVYVTFYALKADGTVWAWGNDSFGQIGDGTMSSKSTPVQIPGLTGIVAIAAGRYHALFLKNDGTVYACGYNSNGQLGDGTTVMRTVPVQVQGLTNVTDIVAGYDFSMALKSDGTVWGWGNASYGRLGTDTVTTQTPTPVQSKTPAGIVDIATGDEYGLALRNDGSVWVWGSIGGGTILNPTYIPVQVATGVKSIYCGPTTAYIVTVDNQLKGRFSNNFYTQIPGYNSLASTNAWQFITDNVETVFPSAARLAVARNTGTGKEVLVSGPNDIYGSLGVSTSRSFNKVFKQFSSEKIKAVAETDEVIAVLKEDGSVWTKGRNTTLGQLGIGTYQDIIQSDFVKVLDGVKDIKAGYGFFIALKNDGTVWSWGYNYSGQLGNGTTANSAVPVQVRNLANVVAIAVANSATAYALKADGTVWAWGSNASGRLGKDPSVSFSSTPVQVQGLDSIIAIAGGVEHVLALRSDGTVWAWGSNSYGELGTSTTSGYSFVPVQVKDLTGIKDIAAGYNTSYALKNDGTVWSWGRNDYGQLGNGNTTNSSVPVQVSGLTGVASIAASQYDCAAVKTDGTVWGWGKSGYFKFSEDVSKNDPNSPYRFTVPVQLAGINNAVRAINTTYNLIVWCNNVGLDIDRPLVKVSNPLHHGVENIIDSVLALRVNPFVPVNVNISVSGTDFTGISDPTGRLSLSGTSIRVTDSAGNEISTWTPLNSTPVIIVDTPATSIRDLLFSLKVTVPADAIPQEYRGILTYTVTVNDTAGLNTLAQYTDTIPVTVKVGSPITMVASKSYVDFGFILHGYTVEDTISVNVKTPDFTYNIGVYCTDFTGVSDSSYSFSPVVLYSKDGEQFTEVDNNTPRDPTGTYYYLFQNEPPTGTPEGRDYYIKLRATPPAGVKPQQYSATLWIICDAI